MKLFEMETTGVQIKAFVNWNERPWGSLSFNSVDHPERYTIIREFELDAAAIEPYSVEGINAFKKKWDINHIWYLRIGVPGVQIWRDASPLYTIDVIERV